MSFPGMNPQFRKTYAQSGPGGSFGSNIESLGWPNQLFSKPTSGNGSIALPSIKTFTNSDYTADPIVHQIFINALSDDTQKQYAEGDLLFVWKPKWSLDSHCYTVFALWNLNHYLHMACYLKYLEENRGMYVGDEGRMDTRMRPSQLRANDFNPNKAASDTLIPDFLQKFRDYPTTVEEFCNSIYFLGVFNTSLDKKELVRKRNISFTVKGRAKIPNLCRPEEGGRYISADENIILWVGYKTPAGPGVMRPDGSIDPDMPAMKVLQVDILWESGSNRPIHCSQFSDPQPMKDVDYLRDKTIALKYYETDPTTGLVNLNAPVKSIPLVPFIRTTVYEQGFTCTLGKVFLTGKNPTSSDIEAASRSYVGWKQLLRYSSLEVIIDPSDYTDVC